MNLNFFRFWRGLELMLSLTFRCGCRESCLLHRRCPGLVHIKLFWHCLLNDCKHSFRNRDHGGLWDQPPSLIDSGMRRLATDFAKFFEPYHIVKPAVSLDVKNGTDTIVTRQDFCNRDFSVLAILAFVNLWLVLAIKVTQVYATVNRSRH